MKHVLTLLLLVTGTILLHATDQPEVVHGHILPPEPDPVVNNSTLLGIDVNKNGVRDDVERWIYETYKDKHPIYIDIAMQSGRAWQKVLEDPSKAKEIHDYVKAPQYCNWYFQVDVKDFGKQSLVNENIYSKINGKTFNTILRRDAYIQYDNLLSGDSYTLPRRIQRKTLCDFNTSKYER